MRWLYEGAIMRHTKGPGFKMISLWTLLGRTDVPYPLSEMAAGVCSGRPVTPITICNALLAIRANRHLSMSKSLVSTLNKGSAIGLVWAHKSGRMRGRSFTGLPFWDFSRGDQSSVPGLPLLMAETFPFGPESLCNGS